MAEEIAFRGEEGRREEEEEDGGRGDREDKKEKRQIFTGCFMISTNRFFSFFLIDVSIYLSVILFP